LFCGVDAVDEGIGLFDIVAGNVKNFDQPSNRSGIDTEGTGQLQDRAHGKLTPTPSLERILT
jgi:hypothetical protein